MSGAATAAPVTAQYMSVVVAPGRTGKRAPLADVQMDVNGTLTAIGGIYTTAKRRGHLLQRRHRQVHSAGCTRHGDHRRISIPQKGSSDGT